MILKEPHIALRLTFSHLPDGLEHYESSRRTPGGHPQEQKTCQTDKSSEGMGPIKEKLVFYTKDN